MYSYGFTSDNYTFAAAAGFSNTYSVAMDGVDEYYNVGQISEIGSATNFSFTFWMKVQDTGLQMLFGTRTSSTNLCYPLTHAGAGADFRWDLHNGSSSRGYCAYTFSLDTWYHVALVYDGGGAANADKMKVYINASNQTLSFTGTIPSTSGTNTADFKLGQANGTTYHYGSFDEFAIYDYSLTSGNVTTIYNSATAYDLDLLSTPPVHWYRWEGTDDETTIEDVGTAADADGTGWNLEAGDIVADVP